MYSRDAVYNQEKETVNVVLFIECNMLHMVSFHS